MELAKAFIERIKNEEDFRNKVNCKNAEEPMTLIKSQVILTKMTWNW